MERVPPGISVRRYPLVERGHLVWIWMGDPESADASAIPRQEWITDPGWTSSQGYFHLSSNYVGLHENLLDLTHLSYLHADTFGTSDYARAPFEAEIGAGSFAVHRKVVPTFLPPIWAKPTGLGGVPAARIVRSEFLSPALHVVNVRFHAADVPESQCPDHQIKTAHIVTPELQDSTHYFFYHARNFARDDDAVTEFMHERLSAAFREDVEGLEAIARLARSWPDSAPPEISIASDKAGVAMRHYLKRLADSEAQTPAVT
jgi:vanillate O-demethylase monooxygenase subunit